MTRFLGNVLGVAIICLTSLPTFATSSVFIGQDESFFEGRSCNGPWENDAMAEFCEQHSPETGRLWESGTRYQYESFETISRALTAEIEADYDMILMVNSAEGNRHGNSNSGANGGFEATPKGAFIPNQHMLVVKKPRGQARMFTRDSRGVITGLASGVQQLPDMLGTTNYDAIIAAAKKANRDHRVREDAGIPRDWFGKEVIPVSTGKAGKMLAFSGIFQVNWHRSDKKFDSNIWAPMSFEMYLGYYYHSRGTPKSLWRDDNRERDKNEGGPRESYAAIHGTTPKKWGLLGVRRDSGGCARTHPYIQKYVRQVAYGLDPKADLFAFDWDFNLPERDNYVHDRSYNSPVLIMVFDRYDTVGA